MGLVLIWDCFWYGFGYEFENRNWVWVHGLGMGLYDCLYICIGLDLYGFEYYFVMGLVLLLIAYMQNLKIIVYI